jgi:hypothetical protein
MTTDLRVAADRPLTPHEREFAENLLRRAGAAEALAFVPQLDYAHVTATCPCGCPTIDVEIAAEFRVQPTPTARLIADALGRTDGKVVGAMIFQDQGLITLMEVYRLEDFSDQPFGLPSIDSIEPIVWENKNSD